MEKDPRKSALQRFLMSSEEMENYSKLPMDEYIRTNEPELFDKIERAKRINEAIDMSSGMGGPMGTIGSIRPKIDPNLSLRDKIEALRKIYQGSVPIEEKSLTKVYEPAKGPVIEASKTLSKSDRSAIIKELERMKEEGKTIGERAEELYEQAMGPRKK